MLTLSPYIHFPGTTRDAMEFYAEVFGGKLRMDTYGDLAAPETPLSDAPLIMHAQLETPYGLTLMGADTPSAIADASGAGAHVSISGAVHDHQPLQQYWQRLIEGGTITSPLEATPWGSVFGAVTDQFGVNWLISIGNPAQ